MFVCQPLARRSTFTLIECVRKLMFFTCLHIYQACDVQPPPSKNKVCQYSTENDFIGPQRQFRVKRATVGMRWKAKGGCGRDERRRGRRRRRSGLNVFLIFILIGAIRKDGALICCRPKLTTGQMSKHCMEVGCRISIGEREAETVRGRGINIWTTLEIHPEVGFYSGSETFAPSVTDLTWRTHSFLLCTWVVPVNIY